MGRENQSSKGGPIPFTMSTQSTDKTNPNRRQRLSKKLKENLTPSSKGGPISFTMSTRSTDKTYPNRRQRLSKKPKENLTPSARFKAISKRYKTFNEKSSAETQAQYDLYVQNEKMVNKLSPKEKAQFYRQKAYCSYRLLYFKYGLELTSISNIAKNKKSDQVSKSPQLRKQALADISQGLKVLQKASLLKDNLDGTEARKVAVLYGDFNRIKDWLNKNYRKNLGFSARSFAQPFKKPKENLTPSAKFKAISKRYKAFNEKSSAETQAQYDLYVQNEKMVNKLSPKEKAQFYRQKAYCSYRLLYFKYGLHLNSFKNVLSNRKSDRVSKSPQLRKQALAAVSQGLKVLQKAFLLKGNLSASEASKIGILQRSFNRIKDWLNKNYRENLGFAASFAQAADQIDRLENHVRFLSRSYENKAENFLKQKKYSEAKGEYIKLIDAIGTDDLKSMRIKLIKERAINQMIWNCAVKGKVGEIDQKYLSVLSKTKAPDHLDTLARYYQKFSEQNSGYSVVAKIYAQKAIKRIQVLLKGLSANDKDYIYYQKLAKKLRKDFKLKKVD